MKLIGLTLLTLSACSTCTKTAVYCPCPTDGKVTVRDAAAAPPPADTLFHPDSPWYVDVSNSPTHPQSDLILASIGNWGLGRMQIDFSLEVTTLTKPDTPLLSWTPNDAFWDVECDRDPVPIPPGGAVEASPDYNCQLGGDCHLIVVDPFKGLVYEQLKVSIPSLTSSYSGGCLAVWDLRKRYSSMLRGQDCTSADAAGFPILALLWNADEIAAGEINHAIRFILPNAKIRHRAYVYPATHGTPAGKGGPLHPPYGVRLRLKSDYPVSNLKAPAQVVARALQKHGMLLSDGGNVALTAQSDRFTKHKWAELDVDPHMLRPLTPSDFEVVQWPGPVIPYKGDCVRAPR